LFCLCAGVSGMGINVPFSFACFCVDPPTQVEVDQNGCFCYTDYVNMMMS
jgi:hypothetical protein